MKFSLLTSVSSVAIGAGLALGALSPAEASPITIYTNSDTFAALPPPNSGTINNEISLSSPAAQSLFEAVQIPFFVAAAGQTLTKVIINVAGSTLANGSITNSSTTVSTNYTVSYKSFLSLQSAGNTPSAFPTDLSLSNDPSKTISTTPGQMKSISLTGLFSADTTTLVSNLSSFTAGSASDFTVDFFGTGKQAESGPNASDYSLIGSAIGSVSITYDYTTTSTPTPEPATLATLGVGLAGLGAIRRRRKA